MSSDLAPRGPGYFVRRLAADWLRPRAIDPDTAFRERVIRSTLAIVTVLTILSLSLNVFLFQGAFTLVSYYTLHIGILAACLLSGVLVSRGHVLYAGWLVVAAVLFGANCLVWLARQEQSTTAIINVIIAYFFVPLAATLVLPRRYILPVSTLTVATYAISLFAPPLGLPVMADVQPALQIPIVFIGLVGEGALLRQFRSEFDSRLETVLRSMRAVEQSKQEAEAARHQAEQDRQRAEAADYAKSQFLANMSHELRTPLNAIIGYDEIMLGGMAGEFTPKQVDLLGRVQHNSRRLLLLINDVLDLSKIESGSVQIFRAPMSPRRLIVETVEDIRSLAEAKRLLLSVDLSAELPEVVMGDASRVQQILVNLLSNAIEFTDSGTVAVWAGPHGDSSWRFTVRDTGIGIPRQAQTVIFDAFRQVDSTVTRRHKGTGLGLAICKRLTERMGGTIEVFSEPGQGAMFIVTLPRTNGAANHITGPSHQEGSY